MTKPLETIEPRSESSANNFQPASVAPRKSEGKRVMIAAFASVAILAYRKFRRSRATVPWQKPSYL